MYSKTAKANRSHAKSRNVKLLNVIILSLAAIALYEFLSLNKSSSLLKEKNDQLSKLKEEYEAKNKELTKKLEDVFEERDSANQSRHELELQLRGSIQEKKYTAEKEMEEMKEGISLAEKQIDRLKFDLQHHGKHAVLEK
jgi:chromosome segregation ATPase